MTRSSSRSPFQTESADLSGTLEDKSADHDVEVKTLADDTDPDPEPAPEPAAEPEAEAIDAVSVVMVHHHLHYVPGQPVALDKPTADAWVNAHIARWPAQD